MNTVQQCISYVYTSGKCMIQLTGRFHIGSLDSKFESLVLPLLWCKFNCPGLAQITESFDSCVTIACNKFLEVSTIFFLLLTFWFEALVLHGEIVVKEV